LGLMKSGPVAQVLMDLSRGEATGHELDAAGKPTRSPGQVLPADKLARLRALVLSVTELLRHFWGCFPINTQGAPQMSHCCVSHCYTVTVLHISFTCHIVTHSIHLSHCYTFHSPVTLLHISFTCHIVTHSIHLSHCYTFHSPVTLLHRFLNSSGQC
jgi:hypothetical protein